MLRIASRARAIAGQFGIGRAEIDTIGLQRLAPWRFSPEVIAASVALNVLGLALPVAILQVYDRIVPQRSYATLMVLVIALCVATLLDALLRFARGYLTAWDGARFANFANSTAFERLMSGGWSTSRREPVARQLQRLRSVQHLGEFFAGRTRLLVLDLPFVPVYLLVMLIIGGPLVLMAVAVVTVFALLTAVMGRHLRAVLQARDRQDTKIHDFLNDVLTGIGAVKGMAMEPQMLRRFERLQRGAAENDYATIECAMRAQSSVVALGNVTMVAIVTAGAVMAIEGHLSIGVLSACTLLSGRIIQPILGAASLWNEVQRTRLGLPDVREVFSLPDFARSAENVAAGPASVVTEQLACASYHGARLQPTSLAVAAGELVAFTGEDGSAKSLLLKLLIGETRPTSGTIRIAGRPPAAFAAIKPGAITYVAADPYFFRGTLLDNLTLFGRGPNAEEARQAAALIGLDADINRLPLGYDTPLGDGITETLPAGLLKRLSIARAVALRPHVLLLDEPQAFLDRPADQCLLQGLARLKGHVTILMATSRPSYLSIADRVFECQADRIGPSPTYPARPHDTPQAPRRAGGGNA